MDMQLSRNYLNDMQHPENWQIAQMGLNDQFGWVQIERLPMQDEEDGDSRMVAWQSVLSACHTLGMKTAFVLRRANGRTKLYLGFASPNKTRSATANLVKQCISIHLPGTVLVDQRSGFSMEEELDGTGTCTGMVTGIPSLQTKEGQPLMQTLDKLARGITSGGNQKNYALVIVADPAKDAEISELQQKLLRVKSEIHTMAEYNEIKGKTEGTSEGESKSKHTGFAMVLGLVQAASSVSFFTGNAAGYLGMTALASLMGSFVGDKGQSQNTNQSLNNS